MERPVVCSENTSRSQEIDTRFSRDCKNTNLNVDASHDRTGRPVVCRQPVGSSSTFNEVDIDFRTSGLPHSVLKQAENSRVRELVKKIENHPHRQYLQAGLLQNNAYNPFSGKSKKMIQDMGSVELFELCETNLKTQCKECLTKNLEKDNSGQFHSGNTSNGTHNRVLPPAGGNGTIPGGADDN